MFYKTEDFSLKKPNNGENLPDFSAKPKILILSALLAKDSLNSNLKYLLFKSIQNSIQNLPDYKGQIGISLASNPNNTTENPTNPDTKNSETNSENQNSSLENETSNLENRTNIELTGEIQKKYTLIFLQK